jgi:hypothetical protein
MTTKIVTDEQGKIFHTFMKRSPLFSIVFVKVGVLFWIVGLAVLLGSPVVTLAAPIKLVIGKTYCSCACVTSAGNKELLWEKVAHCSLNGRSCKADIGDQTVSGTLANCQEFTEGNAPTLAIEPPIVPLPPSIPGDLGQFLAATRLELAILKEKLSTPDLVPLPTPGSIPPEGFCQRNNQGQLLVQVYNQGTTEAGASKTIVKFGAAAPAAFDTPAIAGRTGTELVISIPNGCFDANNNCSFTIGVDAENTVAESEETNNNVAGLCGPQFQ